MSTPGARDDRGREKAVTSIVLARPPCYPLDVRRFRDLFPPIAGSILAGFLGAGVLDLLVTAVRAEAPVAFPSLLVIALGLYGGGGVLAALLLGALSAGVLMRVPARLAADTDRDRGIAAAILAASAGVAVAAMGAAGAQRFFVGKMQNQTLAAIAAGGMVIVLAPLAAAVALALHGPASHIARRLPRSARLGVTGTLLTVLAGLAVLAGLVALSRADWRVLDLGWLGGVAAAAVLGTAHGLFWFRSASGKRLGARWKRGVPALAAATLSLVLYQAGGRIGETSPAYRAAGESSLGVRMALRVARALNDRDGDGYSARFGGGDCDDRRADVFPGAEDVPGDGIDQNCEGGDARAASDAGDSAGPARAATAAAGLPRNVLLITIDAMRADRLGAAGYGRPAGQSLTPNLDALIKRGVYFRRAWAQAPNTPRSFPSLLTSRYPSEIAWKQNVKSVNYADLLPSNHTFFEPLAAAGIKPFGMFSHFYFTADRGLSRGFAEWNNDGAGSIAESNKDIAAPRIVPRAIDRLRKLAGSRDRFALWVHLFEPHSTYVPHKEFPLHESGVPGLMEKYDYEIAFVDIWVGKLLQALTEAGLDKDTAVIVMSDHGEAFGEHKVYFHGQDVFDEQLRVPFVVALPGRPAAVVDDPIMLTDLGPTVLDLMGQPAPAGMRGISVLPRILGQPLPPRPIFAESLPYPNWPHHAVMLLENDHKLIHRVSDRRWELYDLRSDPREKRNLAADPAAKTTFEAMKARVMAFEERRPG